MAGQFMIYSSWNFQRTTSCGNEGGRPFFTPTVLPPRETARFLARSNVRKQVRNKDQPAHLRAHTCTSANVSQCANGDARGREPRAAPACATACARSRHADHPLVCPHAIKIKGDGGQRTALSSPRWLPLNSKRGEQDKRRVGSQIDFI